MSYYPTDSTHGCNHRPTDPVTEGGVVVYYRCRCKRVSQMAPGGVSSLETNMDLGRARSSTPFPLRLRQLVR